MIMTTLHARSSTLDTRSSGKVRRAPVKSSGWSQCWVPPCLLHH